MEAGAVPRAAAPGRVPALTPRLLRLAPDARLVGLAREGRAGAFETIYDRHHRCILAFCRHMLSDADEAEDVLQHTFMAAYSDLRESSKPIRLRPWLFAIARNRCVSILRARRERPCPDIDEVATEALAAQVQRREDLRDLVRDMRRLPEDQRAAIVLAELDALSHAEIGEALEVPREKVKALVFQARESLAASRTARDTACVEIRQQLAVGEGGTLRRSNLRRHLRDCEGCRAFRSQVERQRGQFAVLIPVGPTLALKEGMLASVLGTGGAAAVGGGVIATSAIKTGLAKGAIAALIAAIGTAGTVVISATSVPVQSLLHAARDVPARHAPLRPSAGLAGGAVRAAAGRGGSGAAVVVGGDPVLVAKRQSSSISPTIASAGDHSLGRHSGRRRAAPVVSRPSDPLRHHLAADAGQPVSPVPPSDGGPVAPRRVSRGVPGAASEVGDQGTSSPSPSSSNPQGDGGGPHGDDGGPQNGDGGPQGGEGSGGGGGPGGSGAGPGWSGGQGGGSGDRGNQGGGAGGQHGGDWGGPGGDWGGPGGAGAESH